MKVDMPLNKETKPNLVTWTASCSLSSISHYLTALTLIMQRHTICILEYICHSLLNFENSSTWSWWMVPFYGICSTTTNLLSVQSHLLIDLSLCCICLKRKKYKLAASLGQNCRSHWSGSQRKKKEKQTQGYNHMSVFIYNFFLKQSWRQYVWHLAF